MLDDPVSEKLGRAFDAIMHDTPGPYFPSDFEHAHGVATFDMFKYAHLYGEPDRSVTYDASSKTLGFAPLVRTHNTSPVPRLSRRHEGRDYRLKGCAALVTSKPNTLVLDVELCECIYSTGRTWHVYRATVSMPDGSTHPVVVKLMAPQGVLDLGVSQSATNAISRAVNEDVIYRTRLRKHGLERNAVVKHYGLFITEGANRAPDAAQLIIALVEDAGVIIKEWDGPYWHIPEGYAPIIESRLRAVYTEANIFSSEREPRLHILAQPPFDREHVDTVRAACFGRWSRADTAVVIPGRPTSVIKMPQSQLNWLALISDPAKRANPPKTDEEIASDRYMAKLRDEGDARREAGIRDGTILPRPLRIAAESFLEDIAAYEPPPPTTATSFSLPRSTHSTPGPSRVQHTRQLAVFDGVRMPDGSDRIFTPEERDAYAVARRERLRTAGAAAPVRVGSAQDMNALVRANLEIHKATSWDDFQQRLQAFSESLQIGSAMPEDRPPRL